MHTFAIPSVATKAHFYAELPTQYRFAWVAEDLMHGHLQSAFVAKNQSGWPQIPQDGWVLEIARFEALSRLEDTIGRWTQRICGEQQTIDLVVNNFSGTPSQTVFARILDQAPLKKLVAQLRKLDQYLTGNGQQPLTAVNRFSLTIAEDVHTAGFENLLYRLGRVEFTEKIQVKKLLLQKREKQHWKTVRQFYFSEQTC
jgi:hypothetical protein